MAYIPKWKIFNESPLMTLEEQYDFVSRLDTALDGGNMKYNFPNCSNDFRYAVMVLKEMEIKRTDEILQLFQSLGAYCDCEVITKICCDSKKSKG